MLVDTVLPEVLVGLKDTRGDMVSATLHTLAEMVPLLGPEAVIGTSRRQVFTDSQPRVSKGTYHSRMVTDVEASNKHPPTCTLICPVIVDDLPICVHVYSSQVFVNDSVVA